MTESTVQVYVDAKIIGRHEATPGKNSFVAYFCEDGGLHGFSRVDADQTDEAELEAIAFAIRELKGRLQSFRIMCDNESVVSQIARKLARPSSRPGLREILEELAANQGISVEFFGKNPAHAYLNQELAKQQRQ